jgi:hypothetical protein
MRVKVSRAKRLTILYCLTHYPNPEHSGVASDYYNSACSDLADRRTPYQYHAELMVPKRDILFAVSKITQGLKYWERHIARPGGLAPNSSFLIEFFLIKTGDLFVTSNNSFQFLL